MNRFRMLIVALVWVISAGCATVSNTVMEGQWVAEADQHHALSRPFVLALTPDQDIALAVESSVVQALAQRGITATAGHAVLPQGFSNDDVRHLIGNAVTDTESDSVIVISYVTSESRSIYVAPREETVAVRDSPVFIGYRASADFHYETVFTPGYYKQETDYYLQTSVYRVNGEQLLWQAESKTIKPADINQGIESFSHRLMLALKNDKVFAAAPVYH